MNDGKVSFKTEIQAPSLTKDQLYGTMLKWATERFKPEGKFNARVLYTNEDEGTIAAGGEEYLVFSSSALSLTEPEFIISCLSPAKTENVISK